MITILGGGLAGLSAAYRLIKNGVSGKDILIIEKDNEVGGLAQTKTVDGFRFDLGPHRWFTKSKEIDQIWEEVNSPHILELYRLTRIYYGKKFFNYPLSPVNVLTNLGIAEASHAVFDYLLQTVKNRIKSNPPKNMEDAFIRQFGTTLYKDFFKEYNLKLWGGYGCKELSPDWVKQRVKNLSLGQAILDALSLSRKGKVLSLVDRFKYPSNGTGQLSEKLAEGIVRAGGKIICSSEVTKVRVAGNRITSVMIHHNGFDEEYETDYCISSIPVDMFSRAIRPALPYVTLKAINGLRYRDMLFVVLFVDAQRVMKDNWLYVQNSSVSFNRFMDMGNWNPSLSPSGMTSLVFEVTCDYGDAAWNCSDNSWIERVSEEFVREFGFVEKKKIIGGTVFRKRHTYPVYTLDYKERLNTIKGELRKIDNLQLIGRNGLFRYNNMDHSMASGVSAAKNYLGEKIHIESINSEEEYHEEIRRK